MASSDLLMALSVLFQMVPSQSFCILMEHKGLLLLWELWEWEGVTVGRSLALIYPELK